MRILRFYVLLMVVLLVSGCEFSPVKSPQKNIYTLGQVNQVKSTRYSKTGKSLLVSMPIANPGYTSDKMKYIQTPYRIESFGLNRWVAPPVNMLAPIMAQAVRQTHYFKAVVEPPFSGLTDYDLQTQLVSFEQNFQQPVSRFVLIMQASLINSKTNRVMASRQFDAIIPAPGNNPFSGVLAANKAVAKVSQKIAQFVRVSIR
jgi:cholesterol transport system auxiliary component